METSKKIALFSSICFLISIILCIIVLIFQLNGYEILDSSVVITLLSTTAASFATTVAFYYQKSKNENIYKLKRELLKDRYTMLKEFQVMSDYKADIEMESALDSLESDLNVMESEAISQDGI